MIRVPDLCSPAEYPEPTVRAMQSSGADAKLPRRYPTCPKRRGVILSSLTTHSFFKRGVNFEDRWSVRTIDEVEKAVWSDINDAFSKPVRRSDDSLDYIPTQILSELFKSNGLDGVAYKSSYGEAGCNMALFDLEALNWPSIRS
jgi:hypothetical protein